LLYNLWYNNNWKMQVFLIFRNWFRRTMVPVTYGLKANLKKGSASHSIFQMMHLILSQHVSISPKKQTSFENKSIYYLTCDQSNKKNIFRTTHFYVRFVVEQVLILIFFFLPGIFSPILQRWKYFHNEE
jgi:DNA-binding transcriptional regulator WhiA